MENKLSREILKSIRIVRGLKVILDRDLAGFYGVSTKALNQAVRRNLDRFPGDFMIRLTESEVIALQGNGLRSQFVTLKRGQHLKYAPFAFTELGIAMLSSVLTSARAVQINIDIMRIFAKLQVIMAENRELARRIHEMEVRYDAQFDSVFDALARVLADDKPPIGFSQP